MTANSGAWMRGMVALLGALVFGSCATSKPIRSAALRPGSSWRDVAKTAGQPTVWFSYVKAGRKYDLVTLEKSPDPVLFENSRLFRTLPAGSLGEFDGKMAEQLGLAGLPLEKGVEGLHAWILTKGAARPVAAEGKPFGAGDAVEAATAGAILAPVAPLLLAGGACAAAEHVATGGDRARAQAVNEALLGSNRSFGTFLNQFGRFDFHASRGSYEIREYLATDGAFFTGGDFFYDVGFRDGQPLWVSYRNDAVRSRAVRYWQAHR